MEKTKFGVEDLNTKIRELTKSDTLCGNNILVKFYLNRLKKELKVLGVVSGDVYTLINDSQEVLRIMKKQGQNLEDRCRKYRTAIEGLGFTRKTSKKKS